MSLLQLLPSPIPRATSTKIYDAHSKVDRPHQSFVQSVVWTSFSLLRAICSEVLLRLPADGAELSTKESDDNCSA